jgi:hypothetical protein
MGSDLAASREWLMQLPDETLMEVDEAISRLKNRGVSFESLTMEDMPLDSFSRHISGIRDEIANGRGFVVLKGLDSEKYTLDELQLIYWAFGRKLGTPMPQSYLGDMIGDIRDVSDEEPDPRRRRAYHSGGQQDTHTDTSDIVSMLSLRMAKSGGESRLCSAHTVHNLMLDHCPDLLAQFYEGFLQRTTDTDSAALGRPAFTGRRKPSFLVMNDTVVCSFVRGYIDRAVKAGDHRLSPREAAALEAFRAFSNHPDVCLDYILRPGDMQFFNNRIIMHGRLSFEDHPEKERRRHLFRLWLSLPDWSKLPGEQEDMQKWGDNAKRKKVAVG